MVRRATAIDGPMELGSDMSINIFTNPINVPTIPIAGAKFPIVINISAPNLCLSSMYSTSVSRSSDSLVGSIPSIINVIPLTKKGSLISFNVFSKPNIPSRREIFDISINVSIIFLVFIFSLKNAFFATFITLRISEIG